MKFGQKIYETKWRTFLKINFSEKFTDFKSKKLMKIVKLYISNKKKDQRTQRTQRTFGFAFKK